MSNSTSFHPKYFLLMGIPDMQDSQLLISIPFSIMYVMSVLGNATLILVISANESLHHPMYRLLTMLATSDVLLSTSAVPKTLKIFWFRSHKILFHACLTQVFFIHFSFGAESSILLAMAYDRYCAICHPLTYATSFTPSVVLKIGVFVIIRNVLVVAPFPFLLKRLSFQHSNVIQHTYCEHMSVARLANADVRVNVLYGLIIAACVSGADLILIVASYAAIILAVLRLQSSEARFKAFNTCVSHICVIVLFYAPAYFSFIAHRLGHKHISLQFHIIFANLYILVPPMMNPIIYGIKTREIRQRVANVFSRLTFGDRKYF
ncbi:olfactory receptor 52Z1P-like [Gastrophryne carolinensis]